MRLIASVLFSLILMTLSVNAQVGDLPWYFPEGVVQTSDPVKQKAESLRYFASQWSCYQGNANGVKQMIPGSDSIRIKTDIVSTSGVQEKSSKLVIVLDHYVRVDGKVRVTTLCDQRFITEDELLVVVEDLKEQVKIGSENNFVYYGRLTDKAVASRARHLGISEDEFRGQLDEKISGQEVTYREYNLLPKPQRPSDFVPRELHLGYSPRFTGVLGVAWLNTGLVYYNPQARVRDYLMGLPLVLQHEMVHANTNLQRYPFAGGFDAELLASIPEILLPDNRIDLFFHPYTEPLRKLIRIYFGFNFEQAQKEIFKYDLGGQLIIDEEKFRFYFAKLEEIKAELSRFFEEDMLPEFYSKPLWWMAMNDRRRDDNSVFRIMMAIHYDPTSKGGRENTMLWLEKNKKKIRDIAKESFKKMEKREQGSMSEIDAPLFLVEAYKRMFTETERMELEQYFLEHPELVREFLSDPDKLLKFLEEFKAKRLQGGVK